MLFIIIFFILPHFLTRQSQEKTKTLNIHSPIFAFPFFFLRNTKGETHLFSLWILTH